VAYSRKTCAAYRAKLALRTRLRDLSLKSQFFISFFGVSEISAFIVSEISKFILTIF